jgi:hypothetical protein
MSKETNQDETSGFIVESSDMPEVETAPQEESAEEQASSEAVESEGDDNSDNGKESDSSADDAGEEQTEEAKPSNGVQKRINKVIKEREDAKRENEALQKRIKELEGNNSGKEVKEPVESDFETYDEYLDALDKYDSTAETKGQAKDSENDKHEDASTDNTLTDSQRSAMGVLQEVIESSEGKPEDFEAIALNPEVPITGEMLEALAECDDPVKVMYHLGKNKDAAKSIANKSPAQQMREIAKLDLTVKVAPPKPVKTTKAPDPISPVNGSEQQTKSLSEMTFAEFEAADRERNSKRKSTW